MTRYQQTVLIYRKCREANLGSKDRFDIGFDAVRLADVLLAIDGEYGVDNRGRFLKWISTHTWVEKSTSWRLDKDDLTLQSDECIAFLADLLK